MKMLNNKTFNLKDSILPIFICLMIIASIFGYKQVGNILFDIALVVFLCTLIINKDIKFILVNLVITSIATYLISIFNGTLNYVDISNFFMELFFNNYILYSIYFGINFKIKKSLLIETILLAMLNSIFIILIILK